MLCSDTFRAVIQQLCELQLLMCSQTCHISQREAWRACDNLQVLLLQMQQHIRRHGASVVTRMALPKGFKEWFDSPQRRTAVYSVSKAEQAELTRGEGVNHAVVLAGRLLNLGYRKSHTAVC